MSFLLEYPFIDYILFCYNVTSSPSLGVWVHCSEAPCIEKAQNKHPDPSTECSFKVQVSYIYLTSTIYVLLFNVNYTLQLNRFHLISIGHLICWFIQMLLFKCLAYLHLMLFVLIYSCFNTLVVLIYMLYTLIHIFSNFVLSQI